MRAIHCRLITWMVLVVPSSGCQPGENPPAKLASTDRFRSSLQLPDQFGPWQGIEVKRRQLPYLNEHYLKKKNGWLSIRHYHDGNSNATVSVALVGGPSREVTIHSPELTGFNSFGEIGCFETRISSVVAQFRTWNFHVLSSENNLRISWAFSDDGNFWRTPPMPKKDFAYLGEAPLLKLYCFTTMEGDDGSDTERRFLREFLPVLSAVSQK